MSARVSSRLGSSLVLMGRLLLLLGAAGAVVTALLLQRVNDVATKGTPSKPGAPAYACPMHPEVTASAATVCAICGMALEPVRARARGDGPAQTFSVPVNGQNRLFYDVMFVKTHSITRDMMAPAWADTDGVLRVGFDNDEIALLDPGEAGVFQVAGAGARTVGVAVRLAVDAAAPAIPRDRATSTVRFVVTKGSALTDGTVGWIRLRARTRPMLAVPASAIVQSATGPYVLVASVDRHTFSRRPVQLGRVLFGYAAILGGVREGERVVAMNTFFLDAERRWGARAGGAGEGTTP
jgi:predicted outer membrane lipoprotein